MAASLGRPPERRHVIIKPSSYQSSKAEPEDSIDIRKPDGSRPTPEELAAVLLQPVKVGETNDA